MKSNPITDTIDQVAVLKMLCSAFEKRQLSRSLRL